MDHEARYGAHSYEVLVTNEVSDSGVLYVDADSVTVGPSGALMFAAEMDPLEALEDDGETIRPNAGIEVPPVVVVAPGKWYTVKMVDSDLKSMFTYSNRNDYLGQHTE
jgi:hypothetical protein